ncbi:MAG: PQQ-binding-like beta-propeller repeat protein [Pseudomonadota bacterium]
MRKTTMRTCWGVVAAAAILGGGGVGERAFASDADAVKIRKAPAFTARQLLEPPTRNWITNGGNLYNQRYSPLTQINRENVKDLRAVWRTGMGSGTGPGNSGQAQILAYEGVLYVSNGANDVFAIDVKTGRILWEYRANLDPRAGNPIGRSSRGVALGDGKVFAGQLDGKLVALDQATGKVVWSVQAERWEDGFSITSAPLYYDGLVITGFNGGEMGTRGRVKAYDAKTGRLRWTFYTVPGPGEFGHETWPQDSDAWKHGGAPMWQTPAVDPELGLIYFATGNPGPDLNGSVRPGDNLFSVSIVAIEAKTGKYRWHFQQVHHDIWDYDSSNPVILFDAEIDGRMRKGLVQVGKTGWAYILDRVTGEPLIGIEERPVPQEPRQATAPTQPFPIGDAIVPQEIDIVPEGARLIPGTGEIPNKGRIFTPFWTEEVMVKPGTMGGANWPPSSYDPETHLLYVCATDRISTFQVREPLETPGPNKVYMGGRFGQAQIDDRGIFAALDVRTNRLKWRQAWREICYSGSIVTAGGLLFVGRTDGRLTALDKSTGELLWEFMTDAGVNTTATTFEYDGEQYVVVHAGGGVFAGGKRGDGIWAFSLKGTMDPVKPETAGGAPARGGAAAPPSHGDEAPGAAGAATRAANVENGERIYRQACAACHGVTGEGGQGGGAPLVNGLALQHIIDVTSAGRNNMPAFRDVFTRDELRDIGAYIVEVLSKKK